VTTDLQPSTAHIPEILARDLQLYVDAVAGRNHPVQAGRWGPADLRIVYNVHALPAPARARIRLVRMYVKQNGEEHWRGALHFGPKFGRQRRTVHLVGNVNLEFDNLAHSLGPEPPLRG
jgi:hypothetical protein